MTYFYPSSRAHHAYVMAIDFGMKFTKGDGFWTPGGLLTVTGAASYQIEIAEESLVLLEPRVGDYAMDDYGQVWFVKELKGKRALGCASAMFNSDLGSIYLPRILQRDGKLFHWPEQEKEAV